MTKRIFKSMFIVALSIFVATIVLFMGVLYGYFSDLQQKQLQTQAELIVHGLENEGFSYIKNLDLENYRITWIENHGHVLYDNKTNHDDMENHQTREEVQEAIKYGTGDSSRYSTTLTEKFYYYAVKLSDGSILRVSTSQKTVLTLLLNMVQPILIIFICAFIFSLLLANYASKKIVKPLNNVNLDHPLDNEGYDELSPLLRRIHRQQMQIKEKNEELIQKKEEFTIITQGMQEGIVLLNTNLEILSMNQCARQIFHFEDTKQGFDFILLCHHAQLQELLEKAKSGKRGEIILTIHKRIYQIDISPIESNGNVSGIALFIFDVTEKTKTEQIRKEFSANVSHELKTPLQTISGCAELMMHGLVKPEDISKFSSTIYEEAQRMVKLIEDIIQLSHVEEGIYEMEWKQIDLYEVAKAVEKNLSIPAKKANVEVRVEGKSTYITTIPQLLQTILYNLCENAIKYNKPGGKVNICIQENKEEVYVEVSDTGIGIPNEYQDRIFERFYRVDQSHSKRVEGTGLGLSIVKHAVHLLKGSIRLESEIDKGTTMQLRFPKKGEN